MITEAITALIEEVATLIKSRLTPAYLTRKQSNASYIHKKININRINNIDELMK